MSNTVITTMYMFMLNECNHRDSSKQQIKFQMLMILIFKTFESSKSEANRPKEVEEVGAGTKKVSLESFRERKKPYEVQKR